MFKVALQAGLLFALWPILMNRSGLTGNPMAFVFTLICFLVVFPFTINQVDSKIINLWAIGASIFAALGLLRFTNLLDKTPKEQLSNLFVTMLVVQICVAAIYQITLTGITPQRALGFAAALIAAILLR